jgi:hypothetical protein
MIHRDTGDDQRAVPAVLHASPTRRRSRRCSPCRSSRSTGVDGDVRRAAAAELVVAAGNSAAPAATAHSRATAPQARIAARSRTSSSSNALLGIPRFRSGQSGRNTSPGHQPVESFGRGKMQHSATFFTPGQPPHRVSMRDDPGRLVPVPARLPVAAPPPTRSERPQVRETGRVPTLTPVGARVSKPRPIGRLGCIRSPRGALRNPGRHAAKGNGPDARSCPNEEQGPPRMLLAWRRGGLRLHRQPRLPAQVLRSNSSRPASAGRRTVDGLTASSTCPCRSSATRATARSRCFRTTR